MNIHAQHPYIWLIGMALGLLTQCTTPPPPAATPVPSQPTTTATSIPMAIVIPHTTYYQIPDRSQIVVRTATNVQTFPLDNGITQLIATDTHIAYRDDDHTVHLVDTTTAQHTILDMPCEDIAWHTAPDTLWCIAYANLYILSPTQTTLVAIAPPTQRFVRIVATPHHDTPWVIRADATDVTQLCPIDETQACHTRTQLAQWNNNGTMVATVHADKVDVQTTIGEAIATIAVVEVRYVAWLDAETLFLSTPQRTYSYAITTHNLIDITNQFPVRDLLAVR
ncbi:MAG: hypothetical protein ACK48C_06035 [Roseiflexaceae bacterium]